eukprot:Lithocolla_globosa_v1_NODE_172_length_5458_cov_46.676106.p4 type:complete len:113 gc:universal NODE_172_length_5458_cov_46.676106:4148-3810(-)
MYVAQSLKIAEENGNQLNYTMFDSIYLRSFHHVTEPFHSFFFQSSQSQVNNGHVNKLTDIHLTSSTSTMCYSLTFLFAAFMLATIIPQLSSTFLNFPQLSSTFLNFPGILNC